MGLLADYRRKRQERRHKREDAQAEALRSSLHDEPSATQRAAKRSKKPNPY
jgi:hypothetical protein